VPRVPGDLSAGKARETGPFACTGAGARRQALTTRNQTRLSAVKLIKRLNL